jgi:hypothetical protein
MANTIKPKRSNTASKVPNTSELVSGELGVNMADRKVYINNGTSVVQVGAGTLSALETVTITTPTNGQVLSYNGTAWVNAAGGGGSGTVTSVSGTGTVSGISLSGTVTSSGNLTLGGSLDLSSPPAIGSTTPNTGSFTTGAFSGVASFSAGSAAAPAITRTGDTNTGMFFPSADTTAFTQGGVEAMRIDSNRNIGIGATPVYPNKVLISGVFGPDYGGNQLIVAGQFLDPDGPASAGISLATDSTTLNFFASDSSSLAGLVTTAQRDMTFGTNNTEQMRINGVDGNVAIGTSTTTSKLNVNGQITGRYNALSNIATACDFSTNFMFRVSVSGNKTLTATVPPSGTQAIVMLVRTTTSAATITFGTGFKSTGTVVTSTTSGSAIIVSFVSDGSFLWEASRTVSMV